MAEPSLGSVILLLNLNHTDAAPGVYLKYPSSAFSGSNDRPDDFSESSKALEPGSSSA